MPFLVPFFCEFVAKGCCDTQEYVNHKHHGKDSGGDLERWMGPPGEDGVNHHFTKWRI